MRFTGFARGFYPSAPNDPIGATIGMIRPIIDDGPAAIANIKRRVDREYEQHKDSPLDTVKVAHDVMGQLLAYCK